MSLFELLIEVPAMVLDTLLSDTSLDGRQTENDENEIEARPSDE
ncbi:hypothetical protein [Haloarcula saliterrae]|nr:hypothetical protein [Haloarcula sp. S1CR25-12]